MKLSYDYLKKIDSEYNTTKILLLIIRIRFSTEERLRNELKVELFLMMSKVIVKNIENFWYLAKPHGYANHIIETTELISECFIALEISIKNFGARKTGNVRYNVFQIKPGTENEYIYDYSTKLDFYFYYNKTLTQRLNRTVQKILATNQFPFEDTFILLKQKTRENQSDNIDVSVLIEADLQPAEIIYCVLKAKGYGNSEIARKMKLNHASIALIHTEAKDKIIQHLMS